MRRPGMAPMDRDPTPQRISRLAPPLLGGAGVVVLSSVPNSFLAGGRSGRSGPKLRDEVLPREALLPLPPACTGQSGLVGHARLPQWLRQSSGHDCPCQQCADARRCLPIARLFRASGDAATARRRCLRLSCSPVSTPSSTVLTRVAIRRQFVDFDVSGRRGNHVWRN
jgi:hypothetical protein